ncbi:hypothetical protein E2C06_23395 [Dankookia rubra]|uniref:Uncharacterized protein n=1 Tax=Dankookia rubra TaxID=1442381 RepID=A0A4R5QBG3_9PROT|nr:hypothetical protein E2C06_23395 [Dankookia rubra]
MTEQRPGAPAAGRYGSGTGPASSQAVSGKARKAMTVDNNTTAETDSAPVWKRCARTKALVAVGIAASITPAWTQNSSSSSSGPSSSQASSG